MLFSVPFEVAIQDRKALREALDLWRFEGQRFGRDRLAPLTSSSQGSPLQIAVLAESSGFPFLVN